MGRCPHYEGSFLTTLYATQIDEISLLVFEKFKWGLSRLQADTFSARSSGSPHLGGLAKKKKSKNKTFNAR